MDKLLLVGGGGHCRSVIDVLEACKQPIAGIIHGSNCRLDPVFNCPALGRDADLPSLLSKYPNALVTLGQIKTPNIRKKLYTLLCDIGFNLPSFISPLAYFSKHAVIKNGSIIMHQALVNAGAKIESNCIINTKALIEHDCIIGSHCHIAIGAVLSGGVQVGEGSFIGASAAIMQGVRIGENCIVGMGAVVKKDLEDGEVYV